MNTEKDLILAVDIGNTNIVICGLRGEKTEFSVRLASDRTRTADQYAIEIKGILDLHHVDTDEIAGGILSSVVPYLQRVIPQAVKLVTGIDLIIVRHDMNTGLKLLVDDPSTVGCDLIIAAVAAKAKYPTPMAIFDMGTATTLTVLSGEGDCIGIMIIPGVKTALNALSAGAAQLPYIDLAAPAKVMATYTDDCLRAGSVIGSAAMLDGLMDRLDKEFGKPVTAVLTGGIGGLIAPYCTHDFHLEPDILIDGLRILYDMNKE